MKQIRLPGRGVERLLESQVIQSPLAGVSDITFRRLVRKWAPKALLFTEMINATSLELGHGLCKLNNLKKEEGPIGVQLFDCRPNNMAEAAKRAEDSGAFLIDINMGCPVKKIARKGGGSALIKDPKLAEKIVKEVANAVNIPVTVKTRLGWTIDTSKPIEFGLRMQDAGAQMLTLHGRTREQGFKGSADWDAINKVKRVISIPLIANGDIYSIDDAINCLKITKADGLMIGRGSMGAPWIGGQIEAAIKGEKPIETPKAITRLILALDQLEELLELKGNHGLLIARKHMNWMCKGFCGATTLRNSLLRAKTPNEARKLLKDQIESLRESKIEKGPKK